MAELYSFERYLESYKKIVLTVLSPHVDTLTWWDTWSWDVCPSCICVSRSWFRHFWTSRTPQRWDSWPQDLGVCHYRRGWCPRPSSYLVGFFFPRPGESLTRFPTSERRRSVSSFDDISREPSTFSSFHDTFVKTSFPDDPCQTIWDSWPD